MLYPTEYIIKYSHHLLVKQLILDTVYRDLFTGARCRWTNVQQKDIKILKRCSAKSEQERKYWSSQLWRILTLTRPCPFSSRFEFCLLRCAGEGNGDALGSKRRKYNRAVSSGSLCARVPRPGLPLPLLYWQPFYDSTYGSFHGNLGICLRNIFHINTILQ